MLARQSCQCIAWNACHFTALDCKRIRCPPRSEISDAIPDRSPLSASRRGSIVRLRPRRRWRRWWRRCWWRRSRWRRSRWRRSRRWCSEYGRRKRRAGRHRCGYDGKPGKHPQRNSPAGSSGSGDARWRRPGRPKFRRSVKWKHSSRSGRDRGEGATHHQRSERRWWAKCRTRCRRPLIMLSSRALGEAGLLNSWKRPPHTVSSGFAQAFHPSQLAMRFDRVIGALTVLDQKSADLSGPPRVSYMRPTSQPPL